LNLSVAFTPEHGEEVIFESWKLKKLMKIKMKIKHNTIQIDTGEELGWLGGL